MKPSACEEGKSLQVSLVRWDLSPEIVFCFLREPDGRQRHSSKCKKAPPAKSIHEQKKQSGKLERPIFKKAFECSQLSDWREQETALRVAADNWHKAILSCNYIWKVEFVKTLHFISSPFVSFLSVQQDKDVLIHWYITFRSCLIPNMFLLEIVQSGSRVVSLLKPLLVRICSCQIRFGRTGASLQEAACIRLLSKYIQQLQEARCYKSPMGALKTVPKLPETHKVAKAASVQSYTIVV